MPLIYKSMDIKEMKLHLRAISLIERINNDRQEALKQDAQKLAQGETFSPGEQLLSEYRIQYYNEWINRDNEYKNKALKLLDLAASERDKDLLYRKYVLNQEYFDIAEDLFYSYEYAKKLIIEAEKRLLERINQNEKGHT